MVAVMLVQFESQGPGESCCMSIIRYPGLELCYAHVTGILVHVGVYVTQEELWCAGLVQGYIIFYLAVWSYMRYVSDGQVDVDPPIYNLIVGE